MLNWQERRDGETGLWWWDHAGHTLDGGTSPHRARYGTEAAGFLLAAAQAGALADIEAGRALASLRGLQIRDGGPLHGEFHWFPEETRIRDNHATFFTGLALCALHGAYRDRLDMASAALLREMLADLRVAAVRHVGDEHFFYPNEYLCDAACAWLAGEWTDGGADEADLIRGLDTVADHLLKDGWGWGEHLSDIYADICLDGLSVLLLFAERLPDSLRGKLTALLRELLSLSDFFAGGPRVPAIRHYAFARIPGSYRYRDLIRPLPDDALLEQDQAVHGLRLPACCAPYRTASGGTWTPLGQTLFERGWHALAGEAGRVTPRRSHRIRCANGAWAAAFIDNGFRLGSLSRFPLMPTAEQPGWGLSWQCFPVCLWLRETVWGFLQWETREAGRIRCHPALAKYGTPRALTDSVRPPIAGQTHALQREGDVLALRVMPAVATAWEELTDRFRVVGPGIEIVSETAEGDWSQLVLDCGSRRMAIQCLRLSAGPAPVSTRRADGTTDWSVRLTGRDLEHRSGMVALWGISTAGPIEKPPVFQPSPNSTRMPRGAESQAFLLRWEWPAVTWNARVDLAAAAPLVETPGQQEGTA